MSKRPHHTRRDSNHADVVWGCRMCGLLCYDTADNPGGLDVIVTDPVMNPGLMVWVEIKPDHDAPFTEAEKKILEDNPHTTMVAYCPEDVLHKFGRVT